MEGAERRGVLGIPGTVIYPIAFFFLFAGGGSFQQFYIKSVTHLAGASPWEGAILLGMVYVVYAGVRLLVGQAAYALGEYGILIIAGVTYASFPGALLITNHLPGLAVSCALLGMGGAVIHTVTPSLMLDAGDRKNRRGRSIGTLYFWLNVGYLLGVVVYAAMQPEEGAAEFEQKYRMMAGVATVAALIGVACLAGGPRRIPKRDFPTARRFVEVMRMKGAWQLAVVIFGSATSFGLMLGVLFDVIAVSGGLKWAGLAGFYGARTVITYVSGRYSDHVRRASLLSAAFFLAGVATVLAGIVGEGWMWIVAATMLGIQAGTSLVIPQAIVGDWAGRGRRHIALGAIFVWGNVGVAAAIIGGAAIAQALKDFGWTWAIFGLFFVALGALSRFVDQGK